MNIKVSFEKHNLPLELGNESIIGTATDYLGKKDSNAEDFFKDITYDVKLKGT